MRIYIKLSHLHQPCRICIGPGCWFIYCKLSFIAYAIPCIYYWVCTKWRIFILKSNCQFLISCTVRCNSNIFNECKNKNRRPWKHIQILDNYWGVHNFNRFFLCSVFHEHVFFYIPNESQRTVIDVRISFRCTSEVCFFYLTFHKMKISIPSTYGLLFNKTKNCYETNWKKK